MIKETYPPRRELMRVKKGWLKQILKFYNDKGNWTAKSNGFSTVYDPFNSPLKRDNGDLAGFGVKLINATELQDICDLAQTIKEKLMEAGVNI